MFVWEILGKIFHLNINSITQQFDSLINGCFAVLIIKSNIYAHLENLDRSLALYSSSHGNPTVMCDFNEASENPCYIDRILTNRPWSFQFFLLFKEVFLIFITRHSSFEFSFPNLKSIFHDAEILSYRGPQIWDFASNWNFRIWFFSDLCFSAWEQNRWNKVSKL